jgi:hypothetical protein
MNNADVQQQFCTGHAPTAGVGGGPRLDPRLNALLTCQEGGLHPAYCQQCKVSRKSVNTGAQMRVDKSPEPTTMPLTTMQRHHLNLPRNSAILSSTGSSACLCPSLACRAASFFLT